MRPRGDAAPHLAHHHLPGRAPRLDRLITAGEQITAVLTRRWLLRRAGWTRSRGMRAPEEVAVVGFDDVERARFATPSLTSVSADVEAPASDAVAMLHEQIAGKPGGRGPRITVDFELNVREPSQ
ncbi:substrate-binding domain-containing protein [Nonomuraea sp. KM88]|uniref:substrate-binding domain-containing protein n=1 Tax=Nonomuraea sp. KM88 TaxID=3457427 RepID=UPI003FCEDEA7